jgi:hypothetical protein
VRPPVFILGLQRSGTTWVANQLAALPGVAAVQHPDHQGVHESVFFSHFARNFGDWSDPAARAAFVEAFGASDYVRLMDLPTGMLAVEARGAKSYGDLFARIMHDFTTRQGCDLWIEKSPHHTLLVETIVADIPEARFLMVERGLVDLVWSRLHGFGRRPAPGLRFAADTLRGTVVAVLHRREMHRLMRVVLMPGQGMLVRYEDLTADPEDGFKALRDWLALPSDGAAAETAYPPNSSFAGSKRPEPGPGFRTLVGLTAALAALVPLPWLLHWQRRRDAARGADWPDWVWSQTGYVPPERTPSIKAP